LFRSGSEVTLVHRGEAMSEDVKYWVLPDINNRIKNGEIKAYFRSRLIEICLNEVLISTPEGEKVLPNDYVLLMTGYHPDSKFLASVGIKTGEDLIPVHNPETLESNVRGIYLAGAVLSGQKTNNIFIENGRFHGRQIFEHWERLEQA
jgi:thioredoxin reductase (NADPH)